MTASGEQRWPPWYGPVALVVGLIAGVIGGVIAVLAVEGGAAARAGTLTPAATDIATVVQDLGFVGAALFLASQAGPVRPAQFGLAAPRSWWRSLAVLLAAAVAFIVISSVYFSLLHTSGQEKEFVKEIGGNAGTLGVLAVCALTTVVAPVCEELLFRGFIFRSLSNWRGPWPAAVITGILFGLVHGLSAPAVDLAPLALLGFLLCVVYYRSGSLYICILAHAINNALALSSDESWGSGRTLALLFGSLAVLALLVALLRLASARWMPATD
ncbi:MAG TPA: type II CAAX endopeptidase family protein [Solirubrobacteraceae bacterium]|nr:type II CAAX endopeptidase family protein [Solirubrobacteraceae bacterium]